MNETDRNARLAETLRRLRIATDRRLVDWKDEKGGTYSLHRGESVIFLNGSSLDPTPSSVEIYGVEGEIIERVVIGRRRPLEKVGEGGAYQRMLLQEAAHNLYDSVRHVFIDAEAAYQDLIEGLPED